MKREKSGVVTVTRDVTGIASVVTVTSNDVVALTGGDYTASTVTLNFAANDFTISDDATLEGDEYFNMKLAITSGGVVGTEKQSIVTIVDNEATGGTDYTSTTQTLTFAASGAIAQTVTVPIFGVSSNRSFIAKLVNPSTATKVRSLSTVKVRILDVDNSTTCDSTNDNTGVNVGFGGGAGTTINPYLICSLSQLYRVRNNLTSSFKMMSDVDVDPTLDADPATGGTQSFTPMTSAYTGTFDGNERTIQNFTYVGSGAADTGKAFFATANAITDGSAEIKNINMLAASVTNVGNTAGLLISTSGSATAYVPAILRNLVSGNLNTLGSSSGLIAGTLAIQASASQTASIQQCLSHGKISPATAKIYFGGIVGSLSGNKLTPILALRNLYNTANFVGAGTGGTAGGIIGDKLIGGTWIFGDSSFYRSDAGSFNDALPEVGGVAGNLESETNANMQLTGTYTGISWDIGAYSATPTTIWFNPGVSGVYPSLSGF